MEALRVIALGAAGLVPGALVVGLLLRAAPPRARVPPGWGPFLLAALFTGYLIVTWLAYPLSAAFGVPVGPGSLVLGGSTVSLPLAVLAQRRGLDLPRWKPPGRADLAWMAMPALVGWVYFQNFSFNQAVSSFCLKDNIRLLLQPPADTGYLFRVVVGDQREGGPAFAAGVMGTLSDPLIGARLVFALCGMAIATFTTLAVRRLIAREWVAVVAGLAAALHPLLFRIPGLDENLFSLAVTSFLVFLLATDRRAFLPIAGFAAAYAIAIRHEDVLFLPAMVWWVARRHGLHALPPLLVALAAGIAPTLVRHAVAMGSPVAYESFLQHPEPFPHRFLGIPFEWRGLLNFPFHPEVVRTPPNPYPAALMLPLTLARTSGYFFCALVVLGAVRLFRRDRTAGGFALLWLAPMGLLLSVLEHWDYPSKMSVPVVILNPVFLGFGVGLDGLAGPGFRLERLAGLAVAGALVVAAVSGLNAIPSSAFPADPRYRDRYPCPRIDDPDAVAMQRQWLSDVPVFPLAEWAALASGVLHAPATMARWEWDGHAPWHPPGAIEWLRNAPPPSEPTTAVVHLDATAGPKAPERWFTLARQDDPDAIVLGARPVSLRASGVTFPWTTRPVRLEVTWSPEEATLWVLVSDCDADRVETFCASCSPPMRRESDVRRERLTLDGPPPDQHGLDPETVSRLGMALRMPLPVHVVILDVLNDWADRMVATEGVLDRDGFHPGERSLPIPN